MISYKLIICENGKFDYMIVLRFIIKRLLKLPMNNEVLAILFYYSL